MGIGRALGNEADIVWEDETTGDLDSKKGSEVMGKIQELHEEGRTIVFVTHDRKLGLQCPSQVMIKDGRIVEGDVFRES